MIKKTWFVLILLPFAATGQGFFDWGWSLPTDEPGLWRANSSWLSNAATNASVRAKDGVLCFSVPDAHRGMKWHVPVSPIAFVPHLPWLLVTYCAETNYSQGSDYFIYLDDGKNGANTAMRRTEVKADGQWHEVAVRIDGVIQEKTLRGIAVQVQAGAGGGAGVKIAAMRLSDRPSDTAEGRVKKADAAKVWEGAKPGADFTNYRVIPVPSGAATLKELVAAMRGVTWPELAEGSVSGVPFHLPGLETRLPVTGILQTGELELPVDGQAGEVSVLLAALLRGGEEEVYQRGRAVESISQLDRFSVRVDYTDGSTEDAFPYNVNTGDYELRDGLQVVNVFADPAKTVQRLVFRDKTDRAAIGVLAMSARIGERAFGAYAEDAWPAERYRKAPREQGPVKIEAADGVLSFGPWPSGRLDIRNMPRWIELKDLSGQPVLAGARPWLYTLRLNGTNVPPERFTLQQSSAENGTCRLEYKVNNTEDMFFTITVSPELIFTAILHNGTSGSCRAEMTGPEIGPVVLGSSAEDYYVYPNAGWNFHTRPIKLIARYGGRFPLQFMGVFSAVSGSGVWLSTRSTEGGLWDYGLEKKEDGTRLWLVHSDRNVPANSVFATPPAGLSFGGGDWHEAYEAYKKWALSWRKAKYPRPQWFREVFNFRQKFLHRFDPLFDPITKSFNLKQAVTEAEEHFGGIEYLHLFDWGSIPGFGRVYGRVGDLSPYEYLGGQENFRRAVAALQSKGVPVGLYIEGYLVAEKGRIGIEHGKAWQIMQRTGELMYYQPGSTEMMMCPWLDAWRKTQVETYRQKVGELGVNGMYMDQFGFANPQKDCWSPHHGHLVPGSTMVAEKELADLIHSAISSVNPAIALYGEETPCDVASQYQEGSFSYHMQRCRQTKPRVPLNLTRFADPTFKTFQLLVCDRPTGTWAEGVKWTFFNGDGLWLEGPLDWFAPETRATIRRCHAILRTHKDAFCSEDVAPLIETMDGGIFANRFVVPGKSVYTLYNGRHRQYRGAVLTLPACKGARYADAWREEVITPRETPDGHVLVEMSIDPRGVSCLVVEKPDIPKESRLVFREHRHAAAAKERE